MYSNIFDRLSVLSLFLIVTLLPFFFLPFTNIPVVISKGALLVVGLVLSVIFWGFARFFDGKINLPKSVFLLGGGGIILVFFLSALFVKVSQVSFFGTMFDIGSFWFIFSGFLLMLMFSISFRSQKSARVVLFGAILSSAFVVIFQIAHLFMPEILSLGVLTSNTDSILGSWNELALFAGFSSLISLLVTEFFSTTRIEKWILQTLIILSMFLIAAVNFSLVWGLLGISALVIFVYKISISVSFAQEKIVEDISNVATEESSHDDARSVLGAKKVHFPIFSFAIIIISLLFFMFGQSIGGILPNSLGLSNNEISPSLGTTMEVTRSVLKDNLLFGIGPNKFSEAWAMYKPLAINATINGNSFWDVSFNSGSGLLPTLVSTTGYAGILAWLIFLVLFVVSGVKSIFSSIKNGTNWETMAFFVLSFYLFISSFFYSVGPVIFLLALAFAGIFAGLSASNNENGEISLLFLHDHRKSFFSMLFIVLIIIISTAVSFKYIGRLASVSYFRQALAATTVPEAITSINKALSLFQNDLYLRTYSQIYLLKLNSLAQNKEESLSDAEKADLQASLDQTISGAQGAIIYNPKNYINYQALGSLYQSLASFGVKDAYSRAVEAYSTASTLNPNNPGIKLSMAVVSFADKKIPEAKNYAKDALALKPDYVDAWIMLSQIAKSESDNANALSYAETALSIFPTNTDLIRYVNSIKNSSSSSTVVPPLPTLSSDTVSKIKNIPVKKK